MRHHLQMKIYVLFYFRRRRRHTVLANYEKIMCKL